MIKYIFFLILLLIPIIFEDVYSISMDNVEFTYGSTTITIPDDQTIFFDSVSISPSGLGLSKSGEAERIYNFSRSGGGAITLNLISFDSTQISFTPQGGVTDTLGNVSGGDIADLELNDVSTPHTLNGNFVTFSALASTLIDIIFELTEEETVNVGVTAGGGGSSGVSQQYQTFDLLAQGSRNIIGLGTVEVFSFDISWDPKESYIIQIAGIKLLPIETKGMTIIPMGLDDNEITEFNTLTLVCSEEEPCTHEIKYLVETPLDVCDIGLGTAKCVDLGEYNLEFEILWREEGGFYQTKTVADTLVVQSVDLFDLSFLLTIGAIVGLIVGITLLVRSHKKNPKRRVKKVLKE